VKPRTFAAADALNAFADAVVARSVNDTKSADTKLRQAVNADPDFLPAQLMAMQFFTAMGQSADALTAAKRVLELDPTNMEAARSVARATLIGGDLQEAFAVYDLILRRQPNDAEALNLVAHYAASAGDAARFNATLARLKRVPPLQVEAHEPDLLAEAGQIDRAVQRYYVVEESMPTNSALALKIGRLSVLRHSLEIADIELKKLMVSDPLYGYHILSAYIAAEKRDRATAERALEIALGAAVPGDDSWTCAAEVYAILNDTTGAINAIEQAARRKEPSAGYILANPLFRYLQNDSRFQKVREDLVAQQEETRAALAQMR
jgi:Tfp pilus assembly protein PilF